MRLASQRRASLPRVLNPRPVLHPTRSDVPASPHGQGLLVVLEGNYGGDVTKMPYVVNKEAFV